MCLFGKSKKIFYRGPFDSTVLVYPTPKLFTTLPKRTKRLYIFFQTQSKRNNRFTINFLNFQTLITCGQFLAMVGQQEPAMRNKLSTWLGMWHLFLNSVKVPAIIIHKPYSMHIRRFRHPKNHHFVIYHYQWYLRLKPYRNI